MRSAQCALTPGGSPEGRMPQHRGPACLPTLSSCPETGPTYDMTARSGCDNAVNNPTELCRDSWSVVRRDKGLGAPATPLANPGWPSRQRGSPQRLPPPPARRSRSAVLLRWTSLGADNCSGTHACFGLPASASPPGDTADSSRGMRKRGGSSSEEPAPQDPLCLDRGTSTRCARRPPRRGKQGYGPQRECRNSIKPTR
jgi:hypothetical protein